MPGCGCTSWAGNSTTQHRANALHLHTAARFRGSFDDMRLALRARHMSLRIPVYYDG
jgi:hypothetical protein